WEGGASPHLIVNLAKWNELPKAYQSALIAANRDAGMTMTARYDYSNPGALKRLLAGGSQLRPFPQDVMEACYKAAGEVYAELAQSNPNFKKLHDSMTAYRGDAYMWF